MVSDNKDSKNNEIYSTSDLSLAALLHVYYPIDQINRTNPKQIIFIFKKDKNLELLIEKYWKDNLKVSPLKYFNSLKSLKNIIYKNL